MKNSFANQAAPLIVNVIRERNFAGVQSAMRNGQYDGAMGFDIHLSCLDKEYRTFEWLKKMADFTSKPILALNYNQTYDNKKIISTEEERVELLLLAAKAGMSAIDIQAFTYDLDAAQSFPIEYAKSHMHFSKAKPKEIALNPQIVEKQKELIKRLHDMGTEVLMSCHTGVAMSSDEVVSLALEIEERNPDIIKIITPCETDEQLIESFKTMVKLKKAITKSKIHFHCSGQKGKISRFVNPMLGAYLMFCVDRYTESSNMEQLHLKSVINMISTIDWRQ